MGSGKGQSQTSQTQTYTPNAQAGSYITDALSRAQQTANLPFNIPQAPVAGFSQDQQSAFGNVRNAQGMAQPYINQAQNYFNQSATPDVASFYNPMAQNVTNQLQNIFGQQNAQNTGNLVQSAGGVGADRIAVGQANMANQQGLAAGQTYANLYQQAVQQAQQQQNIQQAAGYGTAAMGSAAQNSALQGAQAQLGTGSLQQQLQQAQLNSPYQQQLAQAAFPYQQAQFYGNMVGSLAPGLGGTTSGQGTSTPAQPSIWSQLLGAGTAGLGALGGSGAFGGQGWLTGSSPSYGGGNYFSGDAYGGSASNPLPGLSASDYGSARGGAIGFGHGGGVRPINPFQSPFIPRAPGNDNEPGPFSPRRPGGANDNGEKYDEGGSVSDKPINVASNPFIPQTQMHAIQPHIPQLQQQQSGDSGGGFGDILKTGAQIATMFLKRGGTVPGYDDGGFVDPFGDDKRALGRELLRAELGTRAPDSIPGGEPAPEPYRLDPAATDAWRNGVSRDMAAGNTAQTPDVPMMTATTHRPGRMTASAVPPATALAFAGKPDASSDLPSEITGGNAYAAQRGPAGDGAPSGGGSDNPFSIPISNRAQERQDSFANSPWAALMQAGLGIMGGTSPFAGVNIGQGGMQGLKTLEQQREASQKEETIAQAAKRLELEAKFHEDQFNRMTVGQKLQQEQSDRPYKELTAAQRETSERQDRLDDLAEKRFNRPYEELTKAEQAQLEETRRQHDMSRVPPGFRRDEQGNLVAEPGGPHSPEQIKAEADAKRLPAMNREDMAPLVDAYLAGDHSVMTGIGRGTQGASNIQQFWNMTAERLRSQGKSGEQIAAAKANFMGQTAALRTAATRAANIETAVNEARGTFPEVLRTSSLLPRSEFTPFNQALEFVRSKTGSPAQRQYGAAMQAAVTAYSQAMSRTGVNSVYAQQHAAEILAKADGPKAIEASVKQLEREMQIAKSAPEETRRAIVNNILGRPMDEGETVAPANGGTTAAPALPDQAKAALKEGQVTTFGNGQKWTLQNGQPVQVP